MCGICGIVDVAGHARASLDLIHAVNDRMSHRGPDGDGCAA
jgi:asparagine synthetase B (glutamine-hydrolysing)